MNWNGFFEAYSKYEKAHNLNIATIDISISKAFNIYLNKVKAELAEGTYTMNKCHLSLLERYFIEKNYTNLSDITQAAIEEFKINKCHNKSNTTINKELQLLIRVFKYLTKLNLYNGAIPTHEKLKEKMVETKYIDLDDIKRINDCINELSFQNQMIYLLLISTGIRRTECSKLEIKNIDLNNNSILLTHTKCHHNRYCYFSNDLKPGIIQLINTNKKYLFENDTHTDHISPNAISCFLKRIGNKLNIENLSSHKLRHSFATYLVKSNVNIREIQELMGHQNLNTTMRYLHNDKKSVKANSINFNPLALTK